MAEEAGKVSRGRTGPSPSFLSGFIAERMDLCMAQFSHFIVEKTEVQKGP